MLEDEGRKFEELFLSETITNFDFSFFDFQVVVYDSDGSLFFASSPNYVRIPYREGDPDFKGYGNIEKVKADLPVDPDLFGVQHFSAEYIFYNKKLYSQDGEFFYFQIARNLKGFNAYLDGALSVLILAVFSGVLVSFVVGYVVSKRSLLTVKKIAETANNVSFDNLSGHLEPLGTRDEFDDLVFSLNNMIDRLRSSVEHQKQFVSDASHELKTPIAVMEGYTNLLRRWGYQDEKVFSEAITTMLKEIKTMRNIIENLLLLARVESQIPENTKVKVDLKKLFFEMEDENQLIYPERMFKYRIKSNLYVHGNYDLLKTLVRIFCENAIKYTPKDSIIEIEAYSHGNISIKVIDHGDGIPDLHKQRVFNRFYRVDESRNRKISGSGIGLSIAKRIVELHEGEVFVEDTPGGGATFHVIVKTYKK
ncbi:MAG: HAMP domain-containing histidine kinase [Spirochaetales bacterium]|nr:HAMP domain-containing histidine kinase [Spirochaetales bacterium]